MDELKKEVIVDLGDSQLSLVLTSPYPLVASGTTGGNFLFNFTLPATEDLKNLFKQYHRPQSAIDIVEMPFRLETEGLIFEGTASIAEASVSAYEIFCPVGNGDFNKAIKETKLNEIDLGGERQLITVSEAVDSNLAEAITYIILASPDSFEEIIVPEFSSININTGGLNLAGTQFINTGPKSNIRVVFNILATVLYGHLRFRVYLDGSIIREAYISENVVVEVAAICDTDSVITWDLLIQNELSNTPDLFDLDFTINSSSKVEIFSAEAIYPTQRYPDMDYALFPIENPEIFANWDDDFYGVDNLSIKTLYSQFFKVLNYFKGEMFPLMLTGTYQGVNYIAGNLLTPFPYIAYLIKRIAFHFNLKVLNNPFEDELKYVVLINHFCENEFLTDDTKLVNPKFGFNLQDHVPDGMTIYDFLKNLCNLFGLGYEVNNVRKELTFNYLEDIISDESYQDISSLVVDSLQVISRETKGARLVFKTPPSDKYFENVHDLDGLNFKGVLATYFDLPERGSLNDCYFVTLSNAYYAWKYNPEEYVFGWVLHSHNYIINKEIGIEPKEITSELVPVMLKYSNVDDTLSAPEGRQWRIPASHQKGRFEGAPEMFQTSWTGMLSYYHGMYPCYPDGTYPFGSPDIIDLWGNPIPGVDLALRLDGENGLYEMKWRKYLEWRIQAKTVKVKILPDRKFMQNMSFSKKLMINGVKYLLVEFRGNIDKAGPKIAELTLLVL